MDQGFRILPSSGLPERIFSKGPSSKPLEWPFEDNPYVVVPGIEADVEESRIARAWTVPELEGYSTSGSYRLFRSSLGLKPRK